MPPAASTDPRVRPGRIGYRGRLYDDPEARQDAYDSSFSGLDSFYQLQRKGATKWDQLQSKKDAQQAMAKVPMPGFEDAPNFKTRLQTNAPLDSGTAERNAKTRAKQDAAAAASADKQGFSKMLASYADQFTPDQVAKMQRIIAAGGTQDEMFGRLKFATEQALGSKPQQASGQKYTRPQNPGSVIFSDTKQLPPAGRVQENGGAFTGGRIKDGAIPPQAERSTGVIAQQPPDTDKKFFAPMVVQPISGGTRERLLAKANAVGDKLGDIETGLAASKAKDAGIDRQMGLAAPAVNLASDSINRTGRDLANNPAINAVERISNIRPAVLARADHAKSMTPDEMPGGASQALPMPWFTDEHMNSPAVVADYKAINDMLEGAIKGAGPKAPLKGYADGTNPNLTPAQTTALVNRAISGLSTPEATQEYNEGVDAIDANQARAAAAAVSGAPGAPYVVGELGPELVVPTRGTDTVLALNQLSPELQRKVFDVATEARSSQPQFVNPLNDNQRISVTQAQLRPDSGELPDPPEKDANGNFVMTPAQFAEHTAAQRRATVASEIAKREAARMGSKELDPKSLDMGIDKFNPRVQFGGEENNPAYTPHPLWGSSAEMADPTSPAYRRYRDAMRQGITDFRAGRPVAPNVIMELQRQDAFNQGMYDTEVQRIKTREADRAIDAGMLKSIMSNEQKAASAAERDRQSRARLQMDYQFKKFAADNLQRKQLMERYGLDPKSIEAETKKREGLQSSIVTWQAAASMSGDKAMEQQAKAIDEKIKKGDLAGAAAIANATPVPFKIGGKEYLHINGKTSAARTSTAKGSLHEIKGEETSPGVRGPSRWVWFDNDTRTFTDVNVPGGAAPAKSGSAKSEADKVRGSK